MADISRVLVGPIEKGYLIKVVGRGTMEFCSQIFELLSDKIENADKDSIGNIYFELSEANYLDSSFIGVIVSVEKKLKKLTGNEVIILNPTDKVKEILSTMGLLELLPIQDNASLKNIQVNEEIQKKLQKDYKDIELLLKSHQNLMELNSENKKRFGLVEEMLKKELERNKKDE